MFGYVTPKIPELRVKEHIFYKSVYCGLCKCMGKHICRESTLTLSYDIVFLALVRYDLLGVRPQMAEKRCIASPLKKKPTVKQDKVLEYCACAGSLLAYYGIEDKYRDSHGIKKLGAGVLKLFSGRLRKKANNGELDRFIKENLDRLAQLEKREERSLDENASCFGDILAGIFSFGLEGTDKRIAEQMGYHLGKWIYIADAADDYEKDIKRGEYTPLDCFDAESLKCAMDLELCGISAAYELADHTDQGIKNIIDNIIYLGLPVRAEEIICKTERKAE